MSDLWDCGALRWIVLGCALLIAPATAAWDGWTYRQLATDGVETAGAVTWKTRKSRRSATYVVEYRFRDAAGRPRTGSQEIGHALYRSLRVGQRIDIVYSRSNPEANAAYPNMLRERVATLALASMLIAICTASAMGWWAYAQRKTREHDAAVGRMPV